MVLANLPESALEGRLGLRIDVERLLTLAEELPRSDRLLLRGVFERGLAPADLARIVGTSPRVVQRRVKRLVGRIGSPEFLTIRRERAQWPPLRRRVAEKIFLHGLPQRTAARELNLSLHRLRQEVERIRGLCDETAPRAQA